MKHTGKWFSSQRHKKKMFFCCVCEAVAKPRICKSDMIDYSSSIIFVPTSQCTPTIDAHPPTQPHTASTSTHTHARTHTHKDTRPSRMDPFTWKVSQGIWRSIRARPQGTHSPTFAPCAPLPPKTALKKERKTQNDASRSPLPGPRLPHAPLYHPKSPSGRRTN